MYMRLWPVPGDCDEAIRVTAGDDCDVAFGVWIGFLDAFRLGCDVGTASDVLASTKFDCVDCGIVLPQPKDIGLKPLEGYISSLFGEASVERG